MDFFDLVREHFFGYNSFFYLRNIIEVTFFTTIIYYFSKWLSLDKKKNLLLYFYSYSFILLTAQYLQLTTISYFLFLFSPVAIMLFILFHQTILQKNFITLKNIVPAKTIQKDWPQEIIRSFLFALNNNKTIYCAIEKNDNLCDYIKTSLILNANIEHDLINILHESSTFNQNKIIWINTNGEIIGINGSWTESFLENSNIESKDTETTFKKHAILLSSKTDALFFNITPTQRKFNVIFKGDIFNNISSDNIINIIKKYVQSKSNEKTNLSEKLKGEFLNEHNNIFFKQRSN